MRNHPSRRPQPAGRVLRIAAVLLFAGQLATGSPGHAADLPLTAEKLTIHVVGNPP